MNHEEAKDTKKERKKERKKENNWKLMEFVRIGVADFGCEYSATSQNLA
ncbi:hypothetical protein [Dolichospermum compactum]|nr:hypothetical protein [Dolichospermum compactum]